jgi:UDP-sulfoquinovose synthase
MGNHIIVLGGDGFCGWPTSLGLSAAGYDVTIVDNLSRRKIDTELECNSLTPIQPMSTRLDAWREASGRYVDFVYLDVAEHYHRLYSLIKEYKPRAVVHFAEQRAAPYSMKSVYHKRYTVDNNINATHNLLTLIVESALDVHVVHLGTMGVYGYGTCGKVIPEGYLNIKLPDGSKVDILYPADPGSVYHMTKCQDAMMFYYYNKNDGVRITDLHQGIVWGTNTQETKLDERLINRFDYDGDYGTVLNRFLMQAAVGHPLTVHGTGGQKRAFIHIQDTVNCVKLAIDNPPGEGDRVHIYNQMTEALRLKDLARIVKGLVPNSEIRYYKNPRKEAVENELKVENSGFKNLGWDPIKLNDPMMIEEVALAMKYRDRCDKSKIVSTSVWRPNMEKDLEGSKKPVK